MNFSPQPLGRLRLCPCLTLGCWYEPLAVDIAGPPAAGCDGGGCYGVAVAVVVATALP